jgi:hypothetical protein
MAPVIEEALFNTPESFHSKTIETLDKNVQFLCKRLSQIPGT